MKKVLIVGLGHIGASLGLRLLGAGIEVVGLDSSSDTLEAAQCLGFVTCNRIQDAVSGVSWVFVATPTGEVVSTVEEIVSAIEAGEGSSEEIFLSDLASVKKGVFDQVSRLTESSERVRYLSLHPMAGREGSGIESAQSEIFTGSTWACCVSSDLALNSLMDALAFLLERVAARVTLISPRVHDQSVAEISHLPHIVSFAYSRLVSRSSNVQLSKLLAAGSYRDLVRVASSSPDRVLDLTYTNREILKSLVEKMIFELQTAFDNLNTEARATEFLSWLEGGWIDPSPGVPQVDRVTLSISGVDGLSSVVDLCESGWAVDSVSVLMQEAFQVSLSK